MCTALLRARQMSLALLVVGVIDHGSLSIDCSGATPNSSGLLRLGRDLMRRSGGDKSWYSCNTARPPARKEAAIRLSNGGGKIQTKPPTGTTLRRIRLHRGRLPSNQIR